MKAVYFDTTYLVKLYCSESGSESVRQFTERVQLITSSLHAHGEFVSTLHRKIREGMGTKKEMETILTQFHADQKEGIIELLLITPLIYEKIESAYLQADDQTYLRAADALHLASASENGFEEIYSNDSHLLASASLFGLKGIKL